MKPSKFANIHAASLALTVIAYASPTKAAETISICELLNSPAAHADKQVTVRGVVFIGMENSNIRDMACSRRSISLDITDVYRHSDVREFRQKVVRWRMRGYATIEGTFIVRADPLVPYSLKVKKVSNVQPFNDMAQGTNKR